MSIEFLITSLIVVAIPGTAAVYTISSAIAGGWRRGLFATVGCTLGVVPHLFAAMLGLSGIMQIGAGVFDVVRWAGVVYLIFIGVSMIRDGGSLRLDGETRSAGPMGPVVWRGILLNLLNPKLTLFFFAFLPQFLDPRPQLIDVELIGLGAMFVLMSLVVFALYAWISAVLRERVLGAPTVQRWIQRSLSTVMVGVAARLAVTDR